MQDLSYALRMLRRSPVASLVVVFSLTLGIGANTAVFSFVNAIQFKPLPFVEEQRLVDISEWSASELCAGCGVGTSYPTFLDWKARAASFQSMAAYAESRYVVSGGSGPERLGGAAVSANLFPTLGVRPALGRGLTADDDRAGALPVVLISDIVWKRRLASDPMVVGRVLRVNGVDRTIVGVMPPGFGFPEVARLWIPLAPETREWKRSDRSLTAIGRLKPGVSAQQADAEIRTIASALERSYPATNARWTARVTSLRDEMTGETAMASTVLLSAVAFVLLIACANVANLLLARASERRREIAIRFALGASRSRVVRLVLAESALLACLGGAGGLVLALWASGAIVAALGAEAPYWIQFGNDWRVLVFFALATVGTSLVCGAFPAWHSAASNPQTALKEGGAVAGSQRGRRLRAALVVSQLALALTLLAGAGLLIKTVAKTFAYDPGYDTTRVIAGDIDLPPARYPAAAQQIGFASDVLHRLQNIDGVRAAVLRTIFFGGFGGTRRLVSVEGMPSVPDAASPTFYYAVTPGYFATLGVTVRDGRDFTDADGADVVIVNEEMARRLWPGQNALGRRLRFGDAASRAPWRTVVGVVGNTGGSPMAGRRAAVFAYVPFRSEPDGSFAITVGTSGDASALNDEVRAVVHDVDPDQPIEGLQTMAETFREWTAPARFVGLLMGALAAVALLLASIGTYGVIAYAVSQRSREIGIRLALGATARQVQSLVARAGLRMMVWGVTLGLAASWLCTRALEGILFGTSPTDPVVFASVTLTLAAVGAAASWLPARRAARVDPLLVLKSE
jgi:putative ABC transport system permease protein